MSSILSSGLYIADSKQEPLFTTNSCLALSKILQNIQDNQYSSPEKVHFDSIELIGSKRSIVGAIIKGFSLGNGKVEIYSRKDLEDNIRGIPGKIAVICEGFDGKRVDIDLGKIHSITHNMTFNRMNFMDPQSDGTPVTVFGVTEPKPSQTSLDNLEATY